MSRRSRATAAAPVVGVAAALAFSAAIATAWVTRPETRTIGEATVEETLATTGMELVPLAVVAALAAVACGVGMLATRGAVRRVVAVLLACAGVGTVAAAATGLSRALALDGAMTAAPWIALPAGALVVAAGVLALGPPAARMPARYDVDAEPADREWDMASDPGAAERGGD